MSQSDPLQTMFLSRICRPQAARHGPYRRAKPGGAI